MSISPPAVAAGGGALDASFAPADIGDLVGVVTRGDQRGRTLGFPTANLPLVDSELRDGVYAGWVRSQDLAPVPAALSVGRRSTFYGPRGVRLLEAHLLDFTGDLYDRTVAVHFGARLRGQRRFASLEGLVAQLVADVEETRRWWELGAGLSVPTVPLDARRA